MTLWTYGRFTQGLEAKETSKPTNPIDQEQNSEPKESKLGVQIQGMEIWSGTNLSSLSHQISSIQT